MMNKGSLTVAYKNQRKVYKIPAIIIKTSEGNLRNQNAPKAKTIASLNTPTNQASPTKFSLPPILVMYKPIKLSFVRWVIVINIINVKKITNVLLCNSLLTSLKRIGVVSTCTSVKRKETSKATEPIITYGQTIYSIPVRSSNSPIRSADKAKPSDPHVRIVPKDTFKSSARRCPKLSASAPTGEEKKYKIAPTSKM